MHISKYPWEKRIREVKAAIWTRVHPRQEFRQILVSTDIALQIKDTLGTDLEDPTLGHTFEGISITVDTRLPSSSVVYIPSDPKEAELNAN